MFTIQSLKLLLKLRNNGKNFICFEDNEGVKIYKETDVDFEYLVYTIKPNTTEIISTPRDVLDMLAKYEYIKYSKSSPDVFDITHEGFHIRQVLSNKLLIFLYKSVLVPIIVSILTTLVLKLLLKI